MALREEAQAALAQSQRLEAIGQLAGGMAHDFNNALAAISGYLDLVKLRSVDEHSRKAIQGATEAIQMGASLTRRLLILTRRQGVGLERLDLNDRVTSTIELLRRTLGEQVTVSLRLSPGPCQTMANPGDVDTAILNLAINARDAMPNGGMLTIETRHVTLDADTAGCIANARPGDFVMLTVRDTGHGMSPEVLKHAMEPLFTTKEPGKGTGLGLATVHSTVRQSGGFVAIDSAAGEGHVRRPVFPQGRTWTDWEPWMPSTKKAPLGDGELILVVEDNDKVRETTVSRLEALGYAVVEAKTGPEAITLLEVRRAHCSRVQRHRDAWRHDGIRCGGVGSLDETRPQGVADLRIQRSAARGERGRAKGQSAWEALHAGTTSLRTPRSARWLNASG